MKVYVNVGTFLWCSLVLIVYGAFKYTYLIYLLLLTFLVSGVFWVCWDLLLFLSLNLCNPFGGRDSLKKRKIHKETSIPKPKNWNPKPETIKPYGIVKLIDLDMVTVVTPLDIVTLVTPNTQCKALNHLGTYHSHISINVTIVTVSMSHIEVT